jgi:hypothetical protein
LKAFLSVLRALETPSGFQDIQDSGGDFGFEGGLEFLGQRFNSPIQTAEPEARKKLAGACSEPRRAKTTGPDRAT